MEVYAYSHSFPLPPPDYNPSSLLYVDSGDVWNEKCRMDAEGGRGKRRETATSIATDTAADINTEGRRKRQTWIRRDMKTQTQRIYIINDYDIHAATKWMTTHSTDTVTVQRVDMPPSHTEFVTDLA